MAKLSRDEILKLASLSRLRLSDVEIEAFQSEIGQVLEYVEKLSEADTDGLEPTYQVTGLVNSVRPDEIIDYGITQDELLKNAPNTEGNYLKVKRMIG